MFYVFDFAMIVCVFGVLGLINIGWVFFDFVALCCVTRIKQLDVIRLGSSFWILF